MKMIRIIRQLVRLKNAQLSRIKEKIAGLEQMNSILSAYLSLLVEEKGEISVPKELIAETVGKYRAAVKIVGDDYRISIERLPEGRLNGKK